MKELLNYLTIEECENDSELFVNLREMVESMQTVSDIKGYELESDREFVKKQISEFKRLALMQKTVNFLRENV